MSNEPHFKAVPPMRCQEPIGGRPRLLCGELAQVMRAGTDVFHPGYFCADHAQHGDLPIPDAGIFRRVSVQVEVLFAAASWFDKEAKVEAVARLEDAVTRAGGLLSLSAVQTAIGRFGARRPAGEANGAGGDR